MNKMKLCTMCKTGVLLDLFVNLIGVYHLARKKHFSYDLSSQSGACRESVMIF